MKNSKGFGSKGFTVVELLVAAVIFAILAISSLSTYVALNSSATLAKKKSIAITLANNKIENVKSLPYDSLLANSTQKTTETVNGVNYDIETKIIYVDDAFDGCVNMSQEDKIKYCRNYNLNTSNTTTDNNGADYKLVNVKVYSSGKLLSNIDSQIAASVAETATSTGALKVIVTSSSGEPINNADITVNYPHPTPKTYTGTTDSGGVIIFYGLEPNSQYEYKVSVSKSGYSSAETIPPKVDSSLGTLTPTFENPNIYAQQSTVLGLNINIIGKYSTIITAVDAGGYPRVNYSISAKGGYKLYTNSENQEYSNSATFPNTNSSGMTSAEDLVPGSWVFCENNGSNDCKVGGQLRYLQSIDAAIGGIDDEAPFYASIPSPTTSPPSLTFSYNGNQYLQSLILNF